MSEDRGAPIAYMALEEGTDVLSLDGEKVGTVEHVLADVDADIFDGLVIDTRLGAGGHRFVDASSVEALYTGGAVLTLDAAAAERLPEPAENPAVLGADPDDTTPDDLGDKLKRAWHWISGNP